jgi:hypothetical protein
MQDRPARDDTSWRGWFRREPAGPRRTDLVILLTPTIVSPGTMFSAAAGDLRRAGDAGRGRE